MLFLQEGVEVSGWVFVEKEGVGRKRQTGIVKGRQHGRKGLLEVGQNAVVEFGLEERKPQEVVRKPLLRVEFGVERRELR